MDDDIPCPVYKQTKVSAGQRPCTLSRHLEVQLAGDEEKMALVIRDDGQGFDVAAAEQGGHYGLAGMRERAALVGGKRDRPGTTVRLTV